MTAVRDASEKAKHAVMHWDWKRLRAHVAREIAAEIEKRAPADCDDPWCGKEGCAHYARRQQALADAALARRMGGIR